jgi:hypothetical protein
MKKAAIGLNIGLTTALLLVLLMSSQNSNTLSGDGAQRVLPQIIKPMDLNRPFDFAGEAVPLDNFDARERLDRELTVNTYWQSSTMLAMKSTRRYFPTIERILKEEGVPEDFKYLAVAESSLRNAVSSAGAKGVWQFMRDTGRGYGLEINEEVDERYHLEKATRSAARYLKDYHRRFGSWTLAAAAYNMGGPRLGSEMEKQRAANYYELNLNEETARYVFRVIALKEILRRPRDFGFFLEEEDYYPALDRTRTVTVSGPIASWGDFARQNGCNYRLLKIYNPWLISDKLANADKKTYEIKVPE